MCCILVCEKRPSDNILNKIIDANPHGIGIAWINKNKKAQYKKGFFSIIEINNILNNLELPYAIHTRMASSGGKSELLCHPFEITKESELRLSGECDKVLMHNGHIHDYEKFLMAAGIYIDVNDKNPMSDSRAISMIIANNNERFLNCLNGYFVIIDGINGKIRLFGDFKNEEQIHFSNMFWKFRDQNNHHIFDHEWYGEFYNREHITNSVQTNHKKELEKELELVEIQKEEDFNISQVQYMSRKERKKFWKRYRNAFKLKSDKENNNSTLPVRIHEQPLKYNNFSDNTQKILGYPYLCDFV